MHIIKQLTSLTFGGIRRIDDAGECLVEADDVDAPGDVGQLIFELDVVEVGGHVAFGVAFGVLDGPGYPGQASYGLQVVDEDLGHPHLAQPLHALGDLRCHVPDERLDLRTDQNLHPSVMCSALASRNL
jgi:hypothetical protein